MGRTYKDRRKYFRKEKALSKDSFDDDRDLDNLLRNVERSNNNKKNKNNRNGRVNNFDDCPSCYGEFDGLCGYCGARGNGEEFYNDEEWD